MPPVKSIKVEQPIQITVSPADAEDAIRLQDLVYGGIYPSTPKSGDYVILDDDLVRFLEVTTGAAAITITLPTLADNQGRGILVCKADSGVGTVIIDGEGVETVMGDLTKTILFQYTTLHLIGGSGEWLAA